MRPIASGTLIPNSWLSDNAGEPAAVYEREGFRIRRERELWIGVDPEGEEGDRSVIHEVGCAMCDYRREWNSTGACNQSSDL